MTLAMLEPGGDARLMPYIDRAAHGTASRIAMRGRLQKEGEVIHVVCDRIVNHDDILRSIGRTDFTVGTPRGDGAKNGGGPDPCDPGIPRGRTLAYPLFNVVPDEEELPRIRSHDFH